MYMPMQAAGWQAPCENSSQPKPSGAARCGAVVLRHVSSCCRWGRPDAQSFLSVLALGLAVLAVANPTAVPAGIPHTNKHTHLRTRMIPRTT